MREEGRVSRISKKAGDLAIKYLNTVDKRLTEAIVEKAGEIVDAEIKKEKVKAGLFDHLDRIRKGTE